MKTLFSNLDKWRHFAGYPLEARVDALIGLFIPRVIEAHFKVKGGMRSEVIPQFPLKQPDDNHSDVVDFFALSKDGGQAFLVEVKTDMGSMSDKQYRYLKRAGKMKMASILCNVKKITKASKSRGKYYHLISALSDLELLELPCELKELKRNGRTTITLEYIRKIKVTASPDLKSTVIYIQPRKSKPNKPDFEYIYFKEFANSIESESCDELGSLLARYLRRWEKDPSQCPPSKAQENCVKGGGPA